MNANPDNPNTYEHKPTSAEDARLNWFWKPNVQFATRYQKVSHILIELDGDGAAGENLTVYMVDGEQANQFKCALALGSLAGRRSRILSFVSPVLVTGGQSLQISYANGSQRNVKVFVLTTD